MTGLFEYLCDYIVTMVFILSVSPVVSISSPELRLMQDSNHKHHLKYRETRFDENMNSMKMTLALKRWPWQVVRSWLGNCLVNKMYEEMLLLLFL